MQPSSGARREPISDSAGAIDSGQTAPNCAAVNRAIFVPDIFSGMNVDLCRYKIEPTSKRYT